MTTWQKELPRLSSTTLTMTFSELTRLINKAWLRTLR
jgi:hypothetical protein